jgi:signal transduction histidine kinase
MNFDTLRASLASFFAINDVIVQFVHGQVFLILGVAMGLQFRQRSALELSRALPWLSAFAVLEAISTWGNSFIPIQTQLLSRETIEALRLLQIACHVLSFSALLGFGLQLIDLRLPQSAAVILPAAVAVAGISTIALYRVSGTGVPDDVINARIEAFMRYTVCLPAALRVAFGLRAQAIRLVGPFNVATVIRSLRVAGYAFVFYALVEGVLVPRVVGLPSQWLSDQTLMDWTGVPIGVVRALVGAVLLVFFFRAIEVFRLEAERAAQVLRAQQDLVTERERISRDLHDGTIQGIYAAGLMLEGVKGVAQKDPASVPERVDAVNALLNRTISDVRGYIYDLRASAADEDLARGLLDIVTEHRMRTGLATDWDVQGKPQWRVMPERRQHVYQVAREALSNVVRHAGANRARVMLTYGESVQLTVADNGTGAVPISGGVGRGMRNMRERAALLDGELIVDAKPGEGTRITLTIWPN